MPGKERGPAQRSVARRWVIWLAAIALVVEACWLTGVNLALRSPATQAWLNSLRPEKVTVSWQSAWSWYPGRVDVRGAIVSGQTPRMQWQAEADRVRADFGLLPLLRRQVEITHASVESGRYLQRPRLEPGKNYSQVLAWFPDIRGYAVAPVGEPPSHDREPWTVAIDGARVSGPQSVWIGRFQARLEARAEARLDVRSQGGPLDLHVSAFHLALERAWADADREVLSGGELSGTLDLGPYHWKEHRGIQALRFLDLDLDLALDSESLEFLKLFLLKYPTLKVDGRGSAKGQVAIRDGKVAPGTDLRIDASDLDIAQPPFAVEGSGTVRLSARGQAPLPFTVAFHFDDLDVLHLVDRSPFLAGQGLALVLEDDGVLVPADAEQSSWSIRPFRAGLNVADAELAVQTFNRYLPPNSPLAFTGGHAGFTADITLTPVDASGTFTLRGQTLRARLDDQDLGLDLRLEGIVAGGTPPERRFNLAGSTLSLDRAWVLGEESRFEESDWSARAQLNTADLAMQRPVRLDLAADLSMSDTRPLAALFRNKGGPNWIARRLTVNEITGTARLALRDRLLYVPEAHLGTEQLEAGMKGVIREPASLGMFYLRYRRLDAALSFDRGETDVILFSPRKKFDAFRIPLPDDG